MAARRVRQPSQPRQQQAIVQGGGGFFATSVLPASKETRFADAAIAAGVAGGSVLWTASRPTEASQLGWGAFWTLLGGLMWVEGSGLLADLGVAALGANSAYLGLRVLHPNLTQP